METVAKSRTTILPAAELCQQQFPSIAVAILVAVVAAISVVAAIAISVTAAIAGVLELTNATKLVVKSGIAQVKKYRRVMKR